MSILRTIRHFSLLLILRAAVCAARADRADPALTDAAAALVQMTQGNYSEASRQTRLALQIRPDDPLLGILAATVLLHTGDTKTAATVIDTSVSRAPNDSLLLYGRGLARLARGDIGAALADFDRSEANGGDRTYLLVARRYAQWLSGAQIAPGDAGVSDALRPALNALQGMTAYRRGDYRSTARALEAAEAGLPGDAIVQTGGLLMSFDAMQPFVTAAPVLPASAGLDQPAHRDGVRGNLFISPDRVPDDVAYVAYELDGQTLTIVNVRPFQYTWDSRRASNGRHTLGVVMYDRDTHEVMRTMRALHIFNPTEVSADSEQETQLRTSLWQALGLRPDRCVCAYALGVSHRALGETATAQTWFARAAAAEPDYRDTRRQLVACGGLETGGATVFGGSPMEKVIALTFDDGPKPGVTEPLLDMLTALHVPATFFVIGRHVMEYPELTKKIADAGIELANHSYTHRNLTRLSDREIAREVMETQAAVRTVTGKTPRYLRPPGGNWNARVAQIVRDWGVTPCMWTVDVYGSEVIGAQQVANAVLAQVQNGSIILMHNGKVSTLQALPTIIRELRARGYRFMTVEALARRLSAVRDAARLNPANIPHRAE